MAQFDALYFYLQFHHHFLQRFINPSHPQLLVHLPKIWFTLLAFGSMSSYSFKVLDRQLNVTKISVKFIITHYINPLKFFIFLQHISITNPIKITFSNFKYFRNIITNISES